MMRLLARIYRWLAISPPRSWFAHGTVSLVGALFFSLCTWPFGRQLLGYMIGAVAGFIFYFFKEASDWAKYAEADQLDHSHGGATREIDGWGDLVGPWFVLLSGLAVYWVTRW